MSVGRILLFGRYSRSGSPPGCHDGFVSAPSPPLLLLLPEQLSDSAFAQGAGEAFAQFRDKLAYQAAYWARLADEEDRDPVRRACMSVKSHAFAQATTYADEALVNVFDLGQQYGAWLDAEPPQDDDQPARW